MCVDPADLVSVVKQILALDVGPLHFPPPSPPGPAAGGAGGREEGDAAPFRNNLSLHRRKVGGGDIAGLQPAYGWIYPTQGVALGWPSYSGRQKVSFQAELSC